MIKTIVTLFLLLPVLFAQAAIRYVTSTGAGSMNGSSWTHAFPGTALQTVITTAAPGDEVWVACGVYVTTAGINRSISFSMRNGVAIYGSFAGTETTLSQRILGCGPCSILSGEIGAPGIADNSYHVISNNNLGNTAILDGFVIRDGNDDRSTAVLNEGLGGGVFNRGDGAGNNCIPVFRNCVFTNNRAEFGGGMFNNGFTNGNASPTVTHCIFYNNHATGGGGAMDNFGISGGNASPSVINCLFVNNTAAAAAGAMYCWGGNSGNASPSIINCSFVNNNVTTGNGGAIVCDRSNTFGGNSGNSNPIVRNTIMWGNTAANGPQFFTIGGAVFTATYSLIDMTGQVAPHIISGAGTGNISSDPLFVSAADPDGIDNCWMTNDDGLLLQNNSPAINAGDNTGVPATDLRFISRIQSASVDMGAYENLAIVLPLRFIIFTATKISGGNELRWTVAEEEADHYFSIEYSTGNGSFVEIGRQASYQSNAQRQYRFTDRRAVTTTSFYRIRYVSENGRPDIFSKTISVAGTGSPPIQFIQNAAGRYVSLQTSDTIKQCRLLGMTGNTIKTWQQRSLLHYGNLSTGIYILEVNTATGRHTIKLMIP
jgi:hypothetical protein